jgi:hypothetical protein
MAFTDQDYIDSIRALAFDGSLKKLVKPDSVTDQLEPDGTRTQTQFLLSNRNIVNPSSVPTAVFMESIDGGAWANSTITNATIGLATASSAPQKSISFMYYFQFFTDPEILAMRDNGLRQVRVDPSNATAVSTLDQLLFQVPCYYAAAEFLRENSVFYVKFYDLTIGGKGLSKNQMLQNVKAMADTYEKKAIQLSDYYYTRKDQSKRPVSMTATGIYGGNFTQPVR